MFTVLGSVVGQLLHPLLTLREGVLRDALPGEPLCIPGREFRLPTTEEVDLPTIEGAIFEIRAHGLRELD